MALASHPDPWTTDEYLSWAQAYPDEAAHTELLDGRVIHVSPEGLRHNQVCLHVVTLFQERFPGRIVTLGASAITERFAPEPDVAVARAGIDDNVAYPYLPMTTVEIAVEVCGASHHSDYLMKPPIYLQAGVEVYAIVDLSDATIVTFRREGDRWAELVSSWTDWRAITAEMVLGRSAA